MAEHVDRTVVSVASSFEEADAADRAYWWAQTPETRLQHVQYLRRLNYGPAADGPVDRTVFEIVDLTDDA